LWNDEKKRSYKSTFCSLQPAPIHWLSPVSSTILIIRIL